MRYLPLAWSCFCRRSCLPVPVALTHASGCSCSDMFGWCSLSSCSLECYVPHCLLLWALMVRLPSSLVALFGRGGGEVTVPPLCDLTQMTRMQVLLTGSHLHRWEPLLKTLKCLRAVIWVSGSYLGGVWELGNLGGRGFGRLG